MTVKELKQQLEHFDDNLIIFIPSDIRWSKFPYEPLGGMGQGVNEADCCLFLYGDSTEKD